MTFYPPYTCKHICVECRLLLWHIKSHISPQLSTRQIVCSCCWFNCHCLIGPYCCFGLILCLSGSLGNSVFNRLSLPVGSPVVVFILVTLFIRGESTEVNPSDWTRFVHRFNIVNVHLIRRIWVSWFTLLLSLSVSVQDMPPLVKKHTLPLKG